MTRPLRLLGAALPISRRWPAAQPAGDTGTGPPATRPAGFEMREPMLATGPNGRSPRIHPANFSANQVAQILGPMIDT